MRTLYTKEPPIATLIFVRLQNPVNPPADTCFPVQNTQISTPSFWQDSQSNFQRSPHPDHSSCPFAPQLTLTTRSGSQLTISLAVDSCGSWMSQGVYYTYASDSLPLFQLLGAEELLP